MMTVPQVRAARALLGWSQPELAERAKVSFPTIQRLENPKYGPQASSLRVVTAVREALEAGGVTFLDASEGAGEGVRLSTPSA